MTASDSTRVRAVAAHQVLSHPSFPPILGAIVVAKGEMVETAVTAPSFMHFSQLTASELSGLRDRLQEWVDALSRQHGMHRERERSGLMKLLCPPDSRQRWIDLGFGGGCGPISAYSMFGEPPAYLARNPNFNRMIVYVNKGRTRVPTGDENTPYVDFCPENWPVIQANWRNAVLIARAQALRLANWIDQQLIELADAMVPTIKYKRLSGEAVLIEECSLSGGQQRSAIPVRLAPSYGKLFLRLKKHGEWGSARSAREALEGALPEIAPFLQRIKPPELTAQAAIDERTRCRQAGRGWSFTRVEEAVRERWEPT